LGHGLTIPISASWFGLMFPDFSWVCPLLFPGRLYLYQGLFLMNAIILLGGLARSLIDSSGQA